MIFSCGIEFRVSSWLGENLDSFTFGSFEARFPKSYNPLLCKEGQGEADFGFLLSFDI
jgi:hypothetical protein